MYYSLKTKKEEHSLEPRISGDFDYAIYDLKGKLLKPKKLVKKEKVVEFIWEKQKELKTIFSKVELKQEKTEQEIENAIKEAKNLGYKESYNATEALEQGGIKQNKVLYQGKERPSLINSDSEYALVSKINTDTGAVSIKWQGKNFSNELDLAITQKKLIFKLFKGIVITFPDLIEQQVCALVAKKNKTTQKEAIEAYREQGSLRLKMYSQLMDMLSESVDIYKEQLTKNHD